jgi:hypothetical protein
MIEAEVMAERFVKQFLKYPDDAEFIIRPDVGRTKPIGGIYYWVIDGKVKAANAFGAKLTRSYSVEIYKKGDSWHPRAVTIDGEQLFFAEQ